VILFRQPWPIPTQIPTSRRQLPITKKFGSQFASVLPSLAASIPMPAKRGHVHYGDVRVVTDLLTLVHRPESWISQINYGTRQNIIKVLRLQTTRTPKDHRELGRYATRQRSGCKLRFVVCLVGEVDSREFKRQSYRCGPSLGSRAHEGLLKAKDGQRSVRPQRRFIPCG
jgi:hypothetical protein